MYSDYSLKSDITLHDLNPNYFRYLSQNFDWLHEQLEDIEDDYILFDCPGNEE